MKKLIIAALTASTLAIVPAPAKEAGAAVKNDNANACWGMDRAYYASTGFSPDNMDIKQSFPGEVGDQLQAWIALYCDPHGPPDSD